MGFALGQLLAPAALAAASPAVALAQGEPKNGSSTASKSEEIGVALLPSSNAAAASLSPFRSRNSSSPAMSMSSSSSSSSSSIYRSSSSRRLSGTEARPPPCPLQEQKLILAAAVRTEAPPPPWTACAAACYQLWKVDPSTCLDVVLGYAFYRLSVLASHVRRQGFSNDLLARLKFVIVIIMAVKDFKKKLAPIDAIRTPVFVLYLASFLFDLSGSEEVCHVGAYVYEKIS